jgi:hypothetical protein
MTGHAYLVAQYCAVERQRTPEIDNANKEYGRTTLTPLTPITARSNQSAGLRKESEAFLSFSVFVSASICVSGGGGGILPEVRNSKAHPK